MKKPATSRHKVIFLAVAIISIYQKNAFVPKMQTKRLMEAEPIDFLNISWLV